MNLTTADEREAWCKQHHAMVSYETGKVVLFVVGQRYIMAETLEQAIEAMDEMLQKQPLLLEAAKE